jgi:hypothetical protein
MYICIHTDDNKAKNRPLVARAILKDMQEKNKRV